MFYYNVDYHVELNQIVSHCHLISGFTICNINHISLKNKNCLKVSYLQLTIMSQLNDKHGAIVKFNVTSIPG